MVIMTTEIHDDDNINHMFNDGDHDDNDDFAFWWW